ncbi:hypothetical protein [Peribacillus loiseleuriae]|uniref:Uncharacterized protein n=1 Tax=Peribacillus loiseleuriae TaxID=1679170 RepID=A0A0K9GTG5_9BACI|nr:hypothetical protein [Peribacillus loiseleuriae]KMY49557.1 hypothetical protein AC625_08365 [Peribacillus loiseleuriae]
MIIQFYRKEKMIHETKMKMLKGVDSPDESYLLPKIGTTVEVKGKMYTVDKSNFEIEEQRRGDNFEVIAKIYVK